MYAAENPKFSAEIAGKQSFFCFGKYSSELVKKQFGQARCETWGSVALVLCCLCTNVNQGALFPCSPFFLKRRFAEQAEENSAVMRRQCAC